MVDKLNGLTRAIATLRKSLAHPAAGVRPAGPGSSRTCNAAPRAAASHVSTLASRLGALQHGDPLRSRKALRLFIEAVLLDEFGGALILDAEFQSLVDKTLCELEAQDSFEDLLAQAVAELLPST